MALTFLRAEARRAACSALVALASLALGAGVAAAETTVKWLHIETNPEVIDYWKGIVARFEQQNPGVKVDMQFLENEAYKSKITTMLQSADPPHIFYSWAGGVLEAQAKAGVLKDLTPEMKEGWAEAYNPAALSAFTKDGKIWGVPQNISEIDFYYNKKLFAKAGVDAGRIKTWNDLLAAVKKLKEAGITPIAVGGLDKWPIHFYWVYLAMRNGGPEAVADAKAGRNGGFAGEAFVNAGVRFKELVDLDPFQPGFQSAKWPAFAGVFGDGKVAMVLAFSAITVKLQARNAADQKGLPVEDIGMFHFPVVEGGKGKATETMGGVNGWLLSRNAPKEAVDFVRFLTNEENQRELGAKNLHIPVYKGTSAAVADPLLKEAAASLEASTYHQNFFDQDLGPAVGRVVNDVSADLASGAITPEDAAQQIEDAWKLEH